MRLLAASISCAAALSVAASASDYVPEPKPVRSSVDLTAFYYPGTEHMPEWDMVAQTMPQAKPLLGWYDEGHPENVDWQIKWAVEHGIGSFCVDWYWNRGEQRLDHWVKAYYRARYRRYLKWYMMYANHNAPGAHSEEDQKAVTRWWIDNYFGTPEYYTEDGRPVVVYYELRNLDRDFIAEARSRGETLQSGEGARRALDITRKMVRDAGLPGVKFYALWFYGYDESTRRLFETAGVEGLATYNITSWYHVRAGHPDRARLEREPVRRSFNYGYIRDASEGFWNFCRSKGGKIPFYPIISTGWDDRPRSFQRAKIISGFTAENFAEVCRRCRAWCETNGVRRAFIAPLNEWQEGSMIEPNGQYGFGMYEALRNAFCERPEDGWPENVTPASICRPNPQYPPMRRSGSQSWDFTTSTEGWYRQPYGCQNTVATNGILRFLTAYDDNFHIRQRLVPFDAAGYGKFRLRMRVSLNERYGLGRFVEKGARMRLKWGSTGLPLIKDDISVEWDRSVVETPVQADGRWHEYILPLTGNPDWTGMIDEVWIEAVNAKHAVCEIDWMRFE